MPLSPRSSSGRRPRQVDEHDVELARAVDALDAVELDVRGGRRAGDERQRSVRIEPGDRVRDGGDDLLGADDADVVIGDERERSPAGCRAAVEDDRAGVGDRERAAGDHRVERFELAYRELVILDPFLLEARRPAVASTDWPGEGAWKLSDRDAVHGRALLG